MPRVRRRVTCVDVPQECEAAGSSLEEKVRQVGAERAEMLRDGQQLRELVEVLQVPQKSPVKSDRTA